MKHKNNVSLRWSLIVTELFIYKHIAPKGLFLYVIKITLKMHLPTNIQLGRVD